MGETGQKEKSTLWRNTSFVTPTHPQDFSSAFFKCNMLLLYFIYVQVVVLLYKKPICIVLLKYSPNCKKLFKYLRLGQGTA